jgi:hypothetical protein
MSSSDDGAIYVDTAPPQDEGAADREAGKLGVPVYQPWPHSPWVAS